MRLSVLPVSLFQSIIKGELDILDWVKAGSNLGLDAVDISILMLKKRDRYSLQRLASEIADVGMDIAVASTYPDFTNPDEKERQQQKEQFEKDLIDLAYIGTKRIRITAGQAHPSVSKKEGLDWATESIIGFIKLAEENNVQLVFENHAKPGVWEYPDFDFPTEIFLEFVDRFKNYPIGFLFDCANPIAYGDDPFIILRKIIDRTVCLHASETSQRGALIPTTAGTGLVPFTSIFSFLKQNHWDGIISIEEASNKGMKGIVAAINNIRTLWENS